MNKVWTDEKLILDDGIDYCPYCGRRLHRISVIGKTACPHCGRAFVVMKDLLQREVGHGTA